MKLGFSTLALFMRDNSEIISTAKEHNFDMIEILREDEGIYVRYYSKPSCEKNTQEDDEKDFKLDQDPENESGVKAP